MCQNKNLQNQFNELNLTCGSKQKNKIQSSPHDTRDAHRIRYIRHTNPHNTRQYMLQRIETREKKQRKRLLALIYIHLINAHSQREN